MTPRTTSHGHPVPVVGIGASAGSLEAVSQLIRGLDPALTFAYVVLQHVSPSHRSMLPEILARETHLTLRALKDGEAPKAGVIHVVPPQRQRLPARRALQPDRGQAGGGAQALHQRLLHLAGCRCR